MKTMLITTYVNFLNNFLTIEKFAEYYSISEEEATIILDAGKKLHELNSKTS